MSLLLQILSRLMTMAVTLFGVAVIVFFVIRVVPGNPIAMMLPPGASVEDIARLEALYGFDKSIPEQFYIWLSGVLQGDFGTSITARQPVLDLVLSHHVIKWQRCRQSIWIPTQSCLRSHLC